MPTLAGGEVQLDKVLVSYGGRNGTLYLTNRRLIFEYSQGVVNKKFFHAGIVLSDIESVSASHPRVRSSQLIITARSSKNGFGTAQIVLATAMNPEAWMRKLNQIVLSFDVPPSSPSVMDNREVVKVPCKYCGTLVDAFGESHCPKCGAPTY